MSLIFKLSKFSIQLLFIFITHNIKICNGQILTGFHPHVKPGAIYIKDSMSDILQNAWKRVEGLEKIRQTNLNYVTYEVGYILHVIQNKYRKMLDKYHAAVLIGPKPLFLFDLIILLEEIEHGFFQIEHIIRMLSQVERKYGIVTPVEEIYHERTAKEELIEMATKKLKESKDTIKGSKRETTKRRPITLNTEPQTRYVPQSRRTTTKKRFNWNKYYSEIKKIDDVLNYYKHYTRKPSTRWWWPIEYGWEIDYAWEL